MNYLLLLIGELVILFYLSKKVSRSVSSILFKIFKSRRIAVYIYSFLFLPGTFAHEFAHFIAAKLLFVPVGRFTIRPKIEGNMITLGSVSIARTDLLRQTIVGIAPFIIGAAILITPFLILPFDQWLSLNLFIQILFTYLVFQIANTMFLSRSDIKGLLGLIMVIGAVLLILTILGIQLEISFAPLLYNEVSDIMKYISLILLFPIAINTVIVTLTEGIHKLDK